MLFTNTDCLCFAKDPAVVRYRSRYWLYYSLRHENGRFGIGIAESADMEHWTPCGEIEQDALCETNGIAAPGAIVLNDKIHLFYQFHPYNEAWGPMHWGHSETTDFVKWTELPIVLAPDQSYDDAGCFSGSAIETEKGHLLVYRKKIE